jgi:hypothetical protein
MSNAIRVAGGDGILLSANTAARQPSRLHSLGDLGEEIRIDTKLEMSYNSGNIYWKSAPLGDRFC